MKLEVITVDGAESEYIEALLRLLKKADPIELYFIWLYASRLIG